MAENINHYEFFFKEYILSECNITLQNTNNLTAKHITFSESFLKFIFYMDWPEFCSTFIIYGKKINYNELGKRCQYIKLYTDRNNHYNTI